MNEESRIGVLTGMFDCRTGRGVLNNKYVPAYPFACIEDSWWRGAATKFFGKVEDTTREAALIATGRKLSPERLAETTQAGLNEIFGTKKNS